MSTPWFQQFVNRQQDHRREMMGADWAAHRVVRSVFPGRAAETPPLPGRSPIREILAGGGRAPVAFPRAARRPPSRAQRH